MTINTVVTCDKCGMEHNVDTAVGWYRVKRVGVDTAVISDLPLPADFCCKRCILLYLEEET